ncbi:MAG: PTS transporter subunit EIIA [Proteobacteria bacterium]|nr:PTS transporter subunit EIIA [Pseudomonadota bacterium]
MRLFQHIRKELIITGLEAKSKADALLRLTQAFKEAGLIQDEKKLYDSVIAREKLMSTGIGKGLAVAHAASGEMQDIAVAVAILSKELDFQSLDQKPVKVIFMIVVNDQRTDLNLKALAGISRMVNKTALLERLESATHSGEVLNIVKEVEGQIPHH